MYFSWYTFWLRITAGLRRMVDAIDRATGTEPTPAADPWEGPPPWWVTAAVLVFAASALGFVGWFLYGMLQLLGSALSFLGNLVDGTDHATAWTASHGGLAGVITDPIQRYLTVHAANLPASGSALWQGWLIAGFVLLVLSFFKSWGARIGWVLCGAVSTAMVWSASPADGRNLAAGVAVLAWALLSVPAFRGAFRRRASIILDGRSTEPAPPAPPVPAAARRGPIGETVSAPAAGWGPTLVEDPDDGA
jgi:hypothetical protein